MFRSNILRFIHVTLPSIKIQFLFIIFSAEYSDYKGIVGGEEEKSKEKSMYFSCVSVSHPSIFLFRCPITHTVSLVSLE